MEALHCKRSFRAVKKSAEGPDKGRPQLSVWGLQSSHTLSPKQRLPFCLNTPMPHRKLSPYAPIPLSPQKPQAVYWTCLIIRETPELFATWKAPLTNPVTISAADFSPLEQVTPFSMWVGGKSRQSRLLTLLGNMHVRGRQAVPCCS